MKQRLKHLLHKAVSTLALLSLMGTLLPVLEVQAAESDKFQISQNISIPATLSFQNPYYVSNEGYQRISEFNSAYGSSQSSDFKCSLTDNYLAVTGFGSSSRISNTYGWNGAFWNVNGTRDTSYGVAQLTKIGNSTPNPIKAMISDNSMLIPLNKLDSDGEWQIHFAPRFKKTSGSNFEQEYIVPQMQYFCNVKKSSQGTGNTSSSTSFSAPSKVEAQVVNGALEVKVTAANNQSPAALMLGFHEKGQGASLFDVAFPVGPTYAAFKLPINSGVITAKLPLDQVLNYNLQSGPFTGASKSNIKVESGKEYTIYAAVGTYPDTNGNISNKSAFQTLNYKVGSSSGSSGNSGNSTTGSYASSSALSSSIPLKSNGRIVQIEYVGEKLFISWEDKGKWASMLKNGYVLELWQNSSKIGSGNMIFDESYIDMSISETIPFKGPITTSIGASTFTKIETGKSYELRILRAYDGQFIYNDADYLRNTFVGKNNGVIFTSGEFKAPTGGYELTPKNAIDPIRNLNAINVSSNSLTLQWDTLNCGSANSLTYIIRSNGNQISQFVANSTMNVAKTSFSVGNLTATTDYTFEVEAQCKSPSSGKIESQKAKAIAKTTIPTVSNQIDELRNLKVLERKHDSVAIGWDNVQCGLNNTLTYVLKQNGTTKYTLKPNSTSTGPGYSQSFDGLQPNTTYTFEVEASCKGGADNSTVTKKGSLTAQTLTAGTLKVSAKAVPMKGQPGKYGIIVTRDSEDQKMVDNRKTQWQVQSRTFNKTYSVQNDELVSSNTTKECTEAECATNSYSYYVCLTNNHPNNKSDYSLEGLAKPLHIFSNKQALILEATASQAESLNKYSVSVVGLPGGGPQNCYNSVIHSPASHVVVSNEVEVTLPSPQDIKAPTFSTDFSIKSLAGSGEYSASDTYTVSFGVQDANLKSCTISNGVESKTISDCKTGTNNTTVTFDNMPVGNAVFTLTATDAGSLSTTQTKTVKLDQTPPTVTANVPTVFTESAVNIPITCSDSESGCKSLEYTSGTLTGQCSDITNGWKSVPENSLSAFTILSVEAGSKHLCVRAEDKAGNKNVGLGFELKRDEVIPTPQGAFVTGDGNTSLHNGVYYTKANTVNFKVSNIPVGASGLKECSVAGTGVKNTSGIGANCSITDNTIAITLSDGDGEKNMTFSVTSNGGVQGSAALKMIKDTVSPSATTGEALLPYNLLVTNEKATFSLKPLLGTDNNALHKVTFRLKKGSESLALTSSNTTIEGVTAPIFTDGALVVDAESNGAFPALFTQKGFTIKDLDPKSNGSFTTYTVEQVLYDKANNGSPVATKSFTFESTVGENTGVETFVPPTITGGTPITLSGETAKTIPLGVTFTNGEVFYTITENSVESSKYPYSGSIYLEPGTHSNFTITFYDAKGQKIGEKFGPFTVNVKLNSATLEMVATSLRTKEAKIMLPITKIQSSGDNVSYKVEIAGSEKATGQRAKSEYGTAFSTPEITLEQNKLNEVFITLKDASGKDTIYKRSIIHDTKAPDIVPSQNAIVNNKAVWAFTAKEQNEGIVSEVKVQPVNTTTGEKGDVSVLTVQSDGKYTYEMSNLTLRPGHEYALKVTSKDDLGNAGEYVTVNPIKKPKSAFDNIDMLQKGVAMLTNISASETARFTLTRSTDANFSYKAEMARGTHVIFGDILSKGKNQVNTTMAKLPIGAYKLLSETLGLSDNKNQVMENYMVDPYYTDSGADLNGDGKVGRSDEVLFNLAKEKGLYPAGDAEIQTLKESITAKLNTAKSSSINEYLKY